MINAKLQNIIATLGTVSLVAVCVTSLGHKYASNSALSRHDDDYHNNMQQIVSALTAFCSPPTLT